MNNSFGPWHCCCLVVAIIVVSFPAAEHFFCYIPDPIVRLHIFKVHFTLFQLGLVLMVSYAVYRWLVMELRLAAITEVDLFWRKIAAFLSWFILALVLCALSANLCYLFVLSTNVHWFTLLCFTAHGQLLHLFAILAILQLLHWFKHYSWHSRAFFALTVSTTLTLYGLQRGFWMSSPVLRVHEVPIASLPRSMDAFRVLLLSDLHIGPTVGRQQIASLISIVNDLHPNLTLLAGDIVDSPTFSVEKRRALETAAEPLRHLAPLAPGHKLFVTGNHDFFTGDVKGWNAYFRSLGWLDLHNSAVRFPTTSVESGALCVIGLEDFVVQNLGAGSAYSFNPQVALKECAPTDATLLMAHQPHAVEIVLSQAHLARRISLYVAGHTHGGQLWPLTWLASLSFRFNKGLYRVPRAETGGQHDAHVYVTEGTFWWGTPLRGGGSQCEITLLKLRAMD